MENLILPSTESILRSHRFSLMSSEEGPIFLSHGTFSRNFLERVLRNKPYSRRALFSLISSFTAHFSIFFGIHKKGFFVHDPMNLNSHIIIIFNVICVKAMTEIYILKVGILRVTEMVA